MVFTPFERHIKVFHFDGGGESLSQKSLKDISKTVEYYINITVHTHLNKQVWLKEDIDP